MMRFVVYTILLTALVLLQSTILQFLIPLIGTVPDLALILLIFLSWRSGPLTGQVIGFLAGLTMDFLSLGPLGYHALIMTAAGYLFGQLKEKITPGGFLLPIAAALIATLGKRGLGAVLGIIFKIPLAEEPFFTSRFAMEAGLNMLAAPLLLLLGVGLAKITDHQKGGFG